MGLGTSHARVSQRKTTTIVCSSCFVMLLWQQRGIKLKETVIYPYVSSNMSGNQGSSLQQTQVAGSSTQMAGYNFEDTKPGKGAKTSNFYTTNNIPERFNNPDSFEGYNTRVQHPMYMTSSMEYGNRQPTVHTMPTSFHSKCQKFTEPLGKCGMYRNHSLNTASDKSIV